MNKTSEEWETKENAAVVLKVWEAQNRQLFRQTWSGLIGTLLVGLTACAVLWGVVPHWKVLWWIGNFSLITISRGFFSAAFQKRSPTGHAVYRWAKLHAFGTATSAFMWGFASFYLWPENSPAHQLVLPICIVSISATAVAMYCTWTPSYVLFLTLSMVPICLRLLLEGSLVYIVLGLLGFLCIAILAHTGKLMHAASLSALVVGARNEALRLFLSQEKTKEKELNTHLQKEIAERMRSQGELRLRNKELEQLNVQLTTTKTNLESTNKELENALANIKQLSGMLPICASCKKIRNDEGYWEQIEAYLKDHSEVNFSHGICPDCAKLLYPDFFREAKKF
jgi:hypothetical protein